MTGRHWLRRDVLLPILYMLGFGAILYWLFGLLSQSPEASEMGFVRICVIAVIIVYAFLVIVTIRHILSTYDLERYDPGNPESLKRLMRRRRFQLPAKAIPEAELLIALEKSLRDRHYRLETESHQIGRIYRRHFHAGPFGYLFDDRVFILQHEPLNVLIVDQLLQDCIRHIHAQADKPARRNLLILVTRMTETPDAVSASAGVVNFLGSFKDGSLCPLLLATRQHRLFYPADRTLMPRLHRMFQNWQIFQLKKLIRTMQLKDTDLTPEIINEYENTPVMTDTSEFAGFKK